MDGDLDVDEADVDVIITEILDTTRGDVNLDGVVTGEDKDIVLANIGQSGGWADGDVNCVGIMDVQDLEFVGVLGDCNWDGTVDGRNFAGCFFPCIAGPDTSIGDSFVDADLDFDGDVDLVDFSLFQINCAG